ncbi:M23 family metallopeptidase [Shinella yambaruensis]|uniref:Peptidase M23 n=1 Tax=Shinella yambaruensis TaxID=415996 RepID=A0ABQ5ZLR9_9HYPH|nr:M23 family metallopeptidase [Shinella yambaruensis]MCJ8025308.1 M23 family metallopeptidase [Shinella yambaruensis]MCU7981058.1 M23 family metallopeptidase [Shinella yambaruensis]GLR53800.1 peptidase M23 [Shinella yambaruensis]
MADPTRFFPMEWPILILLITQILLPAFFLLWLWLPSPADRLGWLTRVVYGAAYFAFVTVIGRWDFLGTALTFLLPVAFVAATGLSYLRVRRRRWNASSSVLRTHGFTAAMAVFFLALTARALSGYGYQETAVDLAFPFGAGTYYVGQGGGTASINHHHGSQSQRFALDIVALNGFGMRAAGLMPENLSDYAIYDREVKSPCNGIAISTHDGIDDNRISETNTEAPAGNHVILACGTARILLAHFRKGSIVVADGAIVTKGETLGRVGNSGNSSEPHLHMHAYLGGTRDYNEGQGVPMTFDGRFLVRGSTVTVP